jgi:transposase-like protein/IS1 family transposase
MKSAEKADLTMTCEACEVICQRFGKHRNGLRRFRCPVCHKSYTEAHKPALEGSYIPTERILLALRLMVEGNSLRSTQRITNLDINTLMKILVKAGEKCAALIGRLIVNIPVRNVEVDEIWSFVNKKQKALESGDDPTFGDAWTFVALGADTKLVLNVTLGRRDQTTTNAFIEGLRSATSSQPFQLTSDGFSTYKFAVETTLSDRVDYATLTKVYRATPEGERRYSPAEVVSTEVVLVSGNPDPRRVCTSHVERQNLSIRMGLRRFTRLTNASSKKFDNHWAALCLWFAYYNFCRVHKSLRVTPAMEAGITDHVWEIEELLLGS